MKFRRRTLDELADMICGNASADTSLFPYRSSSYLSRFFEDADTPLSTRRFDAGLVGVKHA